MPFYHKILEKKEMEKFGSSTQLYAMVVGSSADEFVRHTMNLLGDCGVEFVLCEDVYLAVGELAKNTLGKTIVIGRLEQLSREQGRFFQKVSENGFCCCLADTNSARKRKQILAAMEAGAFVINEPAEIGEVITRFVAGGLASSSEKKGNNGASAFIKDEFLTTKAERDALLEV